MGYGSGGLLPLSAPPKRGAELPCRRMRLAFASALIAGLCVGVALVLSSGPDATTVRARPAKEGWVGLLGCDLV